MIAAIHSIGVTLVLLVGAPTSNHIGPITVQLEIDSRTISLDQSVVLSAILSSPVDVRIENPRVELSGPFKLVESTLDGPDVVDRFALRRCRWTIQPIAAGRQTLGTLRIRYRSPLVKEPRPADSSSEAQEGTIELPTIEVVDRPSAPTRRLLLVEMNLSRWLIGLGLTGLLIVMFIWLATRNGPRRGTSTMPERGSDAADPP